MLLSTTNADPTSDVAADPSEVVRIGRYVVLGRQGAGAMGVVYRAYDEALALLPDADRRAQKPGLMMANIYRTLLREIEAGGFRVLHQRIALTPLRKLWIAMRTNWRGR